MTFTTTIGRPWQIKLIPFFLKKTGNYTVYWNMLSSEKYSKRIKRIKDKVIAANKIETKTIDRIEVASDESERVHGYLGESNKGQGNEYILMKEQWRVSGGEPFGYMLRVSNTAINTLYCKYMGRGPYENWNYCITVDGVTIQTLKSGKNDTHPTNIWEAQYQIPKELTAGKKEVRVLFEKQGDQKIEMPRLMEMRVLKED